MKNKIIRLLVAIGIVVGFLLIVTGINTLIVILSMVTGFNIEYILIPILIAWAIWLVYGIIGIKTTKKKHESNH